MRWLFFVLALSTTVSVSCALKPKAPSSEPPQVTVMAYNVENLFDTKQDPDREDFTFLPQQLKANPQHRLACAKMNSISRRRECLELDWNEDVLERKLRRLADVILGVNGGVGPDLLILEEVENIDVLRRLNQRLKAANYQSVVLIEGPDLRGIDIGMLSRFPTHGEATLHKIQFQPQNENDKQWMARSRGILESTFLLPDGTKLTAFGVHFPSQANPSYWREQAVDTLNQLKGKVPSDHLVIAAGDFNISHEEDTKTGLFQKRLGERWLISHYIGCGQCVGTHNFARTWSFLDAILFSPAMGPEGSAQWKVDPSSINVLREGRYQTNVFNSPAGFEPDRAVGVSDHYPIVAVFKKLDPDQRMKIKP